VEVDDYINLVRRTVPVIREEYPEAKIVIPCVSGIWQKEAKEYLFKAQGLIDEAEKSISTCSEMKNSGLLWNAQKEFVEGSIVLALITKQELPDPGELNVDYSAYLNGLGEAVGELRRYILDSLRKGHESRGEELLQNMDDIYDVLVTFDCVVVCREKRVYQIPH